MSAIGDTKQVKKIESVLMRVMMCQWTECGEGSVLRVQCSSGEAGELLLTAGD